MYNEDLEKLIELALVDGMLNEKEKSVLLKKAQGLGIDQDEFEIVLDAKVLLVLKESQKNSSKFGDIKRCPMCNAPVSALSTACFDCGHEFRNTGANSSIKELSSRLDSVIEKCNQESYKFMIGKGYGDEEAARKDDITTKQKYVIYNFPIPNTQDDILELLHYIKPKIRLGLSSDKTVFAWREKFRELISRGKNAYKANPSMLKEMVDFEYALKTNWFLYLISRWRCSSVGFKFVFISLSIVAFCIFLIWLLVTG